MGLIVGAIDTETTGLDVEKERIIEIAFILYDLDKQKEIARYRRMVNPGKPIPKKITAITGWADADVMNEPQFKDIARLVATSISKMDYITGQNVRDFDCPLILHHLIRAGVTISKFPTIIEMTDYRSLTPDGKMPSLGDACYSLNVEYDKTKAHTAAYDTERSLHCFINALRIGLITLPEKENHPEQ